MGSIPGGDGFFSATRNLSSLGSTRYGSTPPTGYKVFSPTRVGFSLLSLPGGPRLADNHPEDSGGTVIGLGAGVRVGGEDLRVESTLIRTLGKIGCTLRDFQFYKTANNNNRQPLVPYPNGHWFIRGAYSTLRPLCGISRKMAARSLLIHCKNLAT